MTAEKNADTITAKVSEHLPAKQKLAIEFKGKLKNLVTEYQYITTCIDDEELADNLGDVLGKVGFINNTHAASDSFEKLTQKLVYDLKKGHLMLVHYQTKMGGKTIIDLLRAIKRKDPRTPFKNAVIPVFKAKPDSDKLQKLFLLLGGFDINFAIFVTPGATIEANLEAVLRDLDYFQGLLKKNFALDEIEAPPPVSQSIREGAGKVDEYKNLLDQAEMLMDDDPQQAIELFTEAIKLKPDFGALIKRGDVYYNGREFLNALSDYREASGLKKSAADPYAKMSACCFALARETAQTKGPEDAKKWLDRGFDALDDAEAIIEELEDEAVLHPEKALDNPYGHIISALTVADIRGLGLQDEEDRIDEIMTRTLAKSKESSFAVIGDDIDSKIDYAILLARSKYYHEAENVFREVITQDKDSAGPAFNNFAIELRKNGEYGKAVDIYIELLEYDVPDKDIIRQNLITGGLHYAKKLRGDFENEEAESVYKKILENSGRIDGREWVLCDFAMLNFETHNKAAAASRLMEAVYINPKLLRSERFNKNYLDLVRLSREMVSKFTDSGTS